MNLLFTLILIAIVAMAVLFYAKFSHYGAVPLAKAWTSYTTWLSAVGMVFGQFIVDGLQWVAGLWEPFREQFGALLHADNAGMALQLLSAGFFLLRQKAQGFPSLPDLPSIPNDSDKAGA